MLVWIAIGLAAMLAMLWAAATAVLESMKLAQPGRSLVPPRGSWAP